MAQIDLRITLTDAEKSRIDDVMGALASKAQNISGGLKNVGEALMRVTQDRFSSQTDPEGATWAALAPLTVAIRGSSGPILTQSGRLKGSLNYQVGGATLRLGLNTIYAAVHQFGATIEAKNRPRLAIPMGGGRYATPQKVTVPARPMIGFGPKDEQAAKQAVEEWLEVEGMENP